MLAINLLVLAAIFELCFFAPIVNRKRIMKAGATILGRPSKIAGVKDKDKMIEFVITQPMLVDYTL